ncbi:MAG: bifunctional diaminohydroxyphosphoribosylaminopyrimidine deaminase/5-amino-6-(5-phosphoribosylamino)uracil reductase RibD [Spirochaetaceae bacterium]
MLSSQDRTFLSSALSLSRKGGGAVRPNPQVGAVIVQEGKIVSEGYHAKYGGPHAEAVALEKAGEQARGATLYCTLEPCSFFAADKHNEPCTGKIIRAGVRRVVIAQLDPNSRVRGRGARQLREAGIEVETASDDALGRRVWYQNAQFNTAHALNRPFVTLKLAQSLDGKIAASGGDSKWITDEAARSDVHYRRSEHDAVLVGVETVLNDDPRLDVRLVSASEGTKERQPRVVVLDTLARIPLSSTLVQGRSDKLIVYAGDESALSGMSEQERMDFEGRLSRLHAAGASIGRVAVETDGKLSLGRVLEDLQHRKIQSVMVEGGARVATSFVKQALFDALHIYIAPILIGGDGRGLGELHTEKISGAVQFEWVQSTTIGDQTVVSGFRKGWLEEVKSSLEEELHVYGTC